MFHFPLIQLPTILDFLTQKSFLMQPLMQITFLKILFTMVVKGSFLEMVISYLFHCVGHCYLLPTHHKCFPTLRHILHTPHLIHNLLSMDKLCSDTNMYIEFHNDVFFIKDFSKKEILMQGINERDLYKLIGVFSIIITSLTPQALTTSI